MIMFLIGLIFGAAAGMLCATRHAAKHKRQADVEQQAAASQQQQNQPPEVDWFASRQAKKGRLPLSAPPSAHITDKGPLSSSLGISGAQLHCTSFVAPSG